MNHGRWLKRCAYPVLGALMVAGCNKPSLPPTQPQAKNSDHLLSQGNQLLLKGEATGAAEILIRLVGQFPDEALGWDLLSLAYARMGNFKVAHLVGERAVALAPADATVRFHAGVASARAANLQQAAMQIGPVAHTRKP